MNHGETQRNQRNISIKFIDILLNSMRKESNEYIHESNISIKYVFFSCYANSSMRITESGSKCSKNRAKRPLKFDIHLVILATVEDAALARLMLLLLLLLLLCVASASTLRQSRSCCRAALPEKSGTTTATTTEKS